MVRYKDWTKNEWKCQKKTKQTFATELFLNTTKD